MATLKETPKSKPKFRRGEKVVVRFEGYEWFRYGFIKGVYGARSFTRRGVTADIKRGWLKAEFLESRVNEAEILYGSPWIYLVEYTDDKPGAKAQYLSARDISKVKSLGQTLYAK